MASLLGRRSRLEASGARRSAKVSVLIHLLLAREYDNVTRGYSVPVWDGEKSGRKAAVQSKIKAPGATWACLPCLHIESGGVTWEGLWRRS
jgi:hypothetical protein